MESYSHQNQFVAEFRFRGAAEEAIRELGEAKFNLRQFSIVARKGNPLLLDEMHDRPTKVASGWRDLQSLCSTLSGILLAPTDVYIGGVGSVFVAGRAVTSIDQAIANASNDGGHDTLRRMFLRMGISNERAKFYATSVEDGNFVLVFAGNDRELNQARSLVSPFSTTYLEYSEHNLPIAV